MKYYDRRDRFELHVTQARGDYGVVERFRSVAEARAFAQRFISADPTKQAFQIVILDRRSPPQRDTDPSNIVWQYP